MCSLSRAQLFSHHEEGFIALPSDAPGLFPALALRHALYRRHDGVNGLRVAEVPITAELGPPPPARAIAAAQHAGAGASAAVLLAASLAAAGLEAQRWAEANGTLLEALRVRFCDARFLRFCVFLVR